MSATMLSAVESKSGPVRSAGFRPELQAARALAVLLVVAFHVWPSRVTGGYIGVDVFFVLSGFLITAHLLREVAQTGGLSLSRFWARRIRRLLPAAFTVLLVSIIATLTVLPQSIWAQTMREVAAATVYVENWLLAGDSVDYLAAQNTPSIVQHYWSLSVEEQFYIVWPLLVGVAAWFAFKGSAVARRYIGWALAGVFIVSLIYSIWWSYSDPAPAYFVTPTRAWEFAAGGLLALIPASFFAQMRPHTALRAVVSWAGIALIVGAALTFTADTVFPGWLALLPVVGTGAIIFAGQIDHPAAPTFYGCVPVVQLIGDVSYSLYLWHWPVLTVAKQLADGKLKFFGNVTVVIVSILLAIATKYLVEDPVRVRAFWSRSRRPAYILAASGMALLVTITLSGNALITQRQGELDAERTKFASCIGAEFTVNDNQPGCDGVVPEDALFPALASLADDVGNQYSCYAPAGKPMNSCAYGPRGATTRIAIVGDSHAASLVPGLIAAATISGWRLETFVGNGCQIGSRSCVGADDTKQALIDGDYDAVLVTGMRKYHPKVEVLEAAWRELIARGVNLVPVVDVPSFPESTLNCLAASGGKPLKAGECSTSLHDGLEESPDRYGVVGESLGLHVVDLTAIFCADSCPAVIAHVIVYRDITAHITSTFSSTLGPILNDAITRALDGQ